MSLRTLDIGVLQDKTSETVPCGSRKFRVSTIKLMVGREEAGHSFNNWGTTFSHSVYAKHPVERLRGKIMGLVFRELSHYKKNSSWRGKCLRNTFIVSEDK